MFRASRLLPVRGFVARQQQRQPWHSSLVGLSSSSSPLSSSSSSSSLAMQHVRWQTTLLSKRTLSRVQHQPVPLLLPRVLPRHPVALLPQQLYSGSMQHRGYQQRIAIEIAKRLLPYALPAGIFIVSRVLPVLAAVALTAYVLYLLEANMRVVMVVTATGAFLLYVFYEVDASRKVLAEAVRSSRVQPLVDAYAGYPVLMATDRVLFPAWNDEPVNLQPVEITMKPIQSFFSSSSSSSSAGWIAVTMTWNAFHRDAQDNDYAGQIQLTGRLKSIKELLDSPDKLENLDVLEVQYTPRKRTRVKGTQALDLKQDLSPRILFKQLPRERQTAVPT